MRTSWRRRLVVPFLALAALNAGAYAAFTLPASLRSKSIAAREETLRAEIERDRRRTGEARQRLETIRANGEDLQRFYERLGTKTTLYRVREEVASVGRELGLEVGDRSYAVDRVPGAEDIVRVEMRMPVSGSYRQLAAFLDRLERSPHFVTVDQITLNQRTGSAAELSLVLSAFYRGAATPGGVS